MNKYFEQIKVYYDTLESEQRRNVVFAFIFTIVAMTAVGMWSSHTPYAMAISASQGSEAVSRTMGALQAESIPYILDSSGNVLVPSTQLGTARMLAASVQVFPEAEDFSSDFGSPEKERAVLKRLLEKDLSIAINKMNGIQSSNIRVVSERRGNRIVEGAKASAAVMITEMPGYKLSDSLLVGITMYVSQSVEGLDPKEVTISGTQGCLRNCDTGGDEAGSGPKDLAEYKANLEAILKGKIHSYLETIFADTSKFAVLTNVELDPSHMETTSTKRDTENPAKVRSTATERSTENQGAGPQAAGVDGKLPEGNANPNNLESDSSEETSEAVDYLYDTVQTYKSQPQGGVLRRSISVSISTELLEELVTASGGTFDTEQLKKQYEDAIRTGAGLNGENDDLNVSIIPFMAAPAQEAYSAPILSIVEPFIPYVLQLLALGLGYNLIQPIIKKVITTPPRKLESEKEEASNNVDSWESKMKRLKENYEEINKGDMDEIAYAHPEQSAAVLSKWTEAS